MPELATTYDGFISYSHAADDLLAPRLQAGLQKFAKPWWKRRAVRIFRDESSLAANPHLWSSITEALDSSGWFVLLLSPDAANSEWVGKEIEHWKATKPADRILPVVTDGEFGWSDGDVVGSSVPPALHGVFSEEPRWVDLRLARTDEHLDLKNPTFSAAVADIASAIRGVPKDELESEEVRQHRKTIRTVWVAGIALLGMAVVATVFGRQALTERDRANQLAAVADERSTEANVERDRAIEEAAVAETRRLLAQAASVLETDPQLSMLLSLEAYDGAPERILGGAADAIRQAAMANRLLQIVPVAGESVLAVLAPDANMIYQVSITDNVLSALDLSTGQIEWSVQAADSGWEAAFLSIDADGQLLALSLKARNEEPNRVDVFDTTGQHVHTIHTSGCPIAGAIGPGLSPDGRRLSISDGTPDCDQGFSRVRPEADWAVVYETDTWQQEYVYRVDGGHQESVRFSGNSDFMLASSWGNSEVNLEVFRYPSFTSIVTATNDEDSFAFDERNLVYVLFDVQCREGVSCGDTYDDALSVVRALSFRTGVTNQLDLSLERNEVFDYRAENEDEGVGENVFLLSPDGTKLSVLWDGPQRVFDTTTGDGLLPTYPPKRAYSHSWSADSSKLLIAQADALYLWAVVPGRVTPPGGATGDWVTFARTDVLVRGFTGAECIVFNIEPCPTLEQVRSR